MLRRLSDVGPTRHKPRRWPRPQEEQQPIQGGRNTIVRAKPPFMHYALIPLTDFVA